MSVFTKVTHAELQDFLRQYPVGEVVGFQGIGEGVENTNYFVDTDDGRWVLTLFERLNYADLPFFLGLMEHLAGHGFPSAAPLHTHDGRSLVTLNGKPAAIVRRLVGQSVLFPNAAQCRATGTVLGQLHRVAGSFKGHAENSRGVAWRRDTAQALLPLLPDDARALIDSELSAQAGLDLAALPQGIVHADLFRDNVLFVDDRLTGVIDFYYACNDSLLYDLAITVNDWCFDTHGQPNLSRAREMIDAYCAERQPVEPEARDWRLVLRAAALRFYLSRLHDWVHPREGGLVHVKDPDAYRRILEFHREHELPLA
ncbi:MAG: homoserine kinase [Panacagrimonas sp.]|jgi:homoserine kinase type II|nr:homoserine kinase [Panacagrimonas sp.]MCC2659130.1 homoserine kinase [Panacagrimonas sp.]